MLVQIAPPAILRPGLTTHTLTTMLQVVTGSDKGKVATIKSVCSKTGKIIVEGVNIKTNTVAPMKEGETGKLEQKEYPIHHSNVMLYSTTQNVRSRVGHKEVDGKKVRYLVKTGEVLN
jgi:large subunit ribosomal protein L24